jgi:hypothetical protein
LSGRKLYVHAIGTFGGPDNVYISDVNSDLIAETPDISTVGKTGIKMDMTWRSNGQGSGDQDYGLIGYSINSGASYTWLPTHYIGQASCVTASGIAFPAGCEGITSFRIAFRFISNATSCSACDPPFNVDDILVKSATCPTYYYDVDDDGYGTGASIAQCTRPTNGYLASELTATTGDCDDGNGSIHPGAPELCNGIDDNCNGQIDEGQQGNALQFNGLNNYVNVGVRPNLEMSSAITLEAWIYPMGQGSATIEGGVIMSREGEYEVARFNDGTIRFAIANTTPGWDWINTGYIAALNTWTHIAFTYSATLGIAKVYANGAEVYSSPASGNIGDIAESVTEDEFWIAARQHDHGPGKLHANFNGSIEEVRVWSTSLSQVVIQQWINRNITSSHPNFANLQGYWKFDEGAGVSTADASGNGNTGTLINSPIWIPSTVSIDLNTFYRDADNDGFGNPTSTIQACSTPVGYVADNTDCDDGNDAINPATKWYTDADGDAYGTGAFVTQCTRPTHGFLASELTATSGDCNDLDASVHIPVTYYMDADEDGFGDPNNTTSTCSAAPPSGYVANSSDCDDSKLLYTDADGDSYGTGAPVACGVPNNTDCDDANSNVHAPIIYYADADGDGFGDPNNTTSVCTATPPADYVADNSDCDDTKLLYTDADGDGYGAGDPVACGVPNNTDCNDADGSVHAPITYFKDGDGDGFGDANSTTSVCAATPPSGYVSNSTDCDDTKLLYTDSDGDSYGAGAPVACGIADNTDCNDADAAVHTHITYYKDNDEDGFGDPSSTTSVCSATPPVGYVANHSDCDDSKLLYADSDDDGYGAGAPVACGVTGNTDCNDQDASVHQVITYYRDQDGDGFGDPANTTSVCVSMAPAGYVANNTDCDDAEVTYKDADGDGFGSTTVVACGVANNTDCSDADASVHTQITYYADTDGDGFGDASNTSNVCSATPPTGYVTNSADCDDSKLLYADGDGDGYGAGSPVACGVADNSDCNDQDAAVHTLITYYRDNDGDGFGDDAQPTSVCSATAPIGYVANNNDCDDSKLLYTDSDGDGFGAGTPVACGVADHTDCDDAEAAVHTMATYYKDGDGDGFGDAAHTTAVCSATPPSGYVTNSADCDDTKLLYIDADGDGYGSGAPVACGITDNSDCNDADGSVHSAITYYKDSDGDGFGDLNSTTTICASTPPVGYVTDHSDCDDTRLLYTDSDGDGYGFGSPVACGVANNGDCNDLDGSIHAPVTYYKDEDGDGFGNAANTTSVCSSAAPTGYVSNSLDCDDTKLLYRDSDGDGFGTGTPVACGVANNTDCNDADGSIHAPVTYYKDADGDGFGNLNNATSVCSATPPSGYVMNHSDCDDTKLLYTDADGDGFGTGAPVACGVANSTDCNDAITAIHPGAVEVCGNSIDDNCNGVIDENCTTTCSNATGLSTTNITSTSAKLNWVAAGNPAQWQVQYKSTANGAKWIDVLVAGSARSVSITGLKPKQNYNWHIRAKCGTKWTSYSNAFSFKTLATTTVVTFQAAEPNATKQKEQVLQVNVQPNPTSTYFTLIIQSTSDRAVELRVFDEVGRAVEGRAGIAANSTLRIGSTYRPGVYVAQVVQGGKMVTVKLIKQIY